MTFNVALDLLGQSFGRLTVISRDGSNSTGQATWLCRCSCGGTRVARGDNLRRGRSTSCGCLTSEKVRAACGNNCPPFSLRHGHKSGGRPSSEYATWNSMRQRCSNPKVRNYANYGGRGITVHPRWDSFENFLADMGKKPAAGMSLDRINNELGYFPENCRWTTHSEQNRNRRARRMQANNTSGFTGVHRTPSQTKPWRASIWVDGKHIYLGFFPTAEEASAVYQAAVAAKKAEGAGLNV